MSYSTSSFQTALQHYGDDDYYNIDNLAYTAFDGNGVLHVYCDDECLVDSGNRDVNNTGSACVRVKYEGYSMGGIIPTTNRRRIIPIPVHLKLNGLLHLSV